MKKQLLYLLFLIFSVDTSFTQEKNINDFYDHADDFFSMYVKKGLVDYEALKDKRTLTKLIHNIENQDIEKFSDPEKKAFYINAYNLLVIKSVVEHYPVNSVMEITGFFDSKKHGVAGEKMTLNELEKEKLIKKYKDARLHFVLVCGALGCPPITNFAYRPGQLDKQLKLQTRIALNNSEFIRVNDETKSVQISEIFQWYASDFGKDKTEIINFINQYRFSEIPFDYTIGYYTYNWDLNEQKTQKPADTRANNRFRYVVSSAIPKGSHEQKLFNNLYTQFIEESDNQGSRSTYFTSTYSHLYGLRNDFNLGVEVKYRRVRNDILPSSAFGVFKPAGNSEFRQGITYVGPKIRWAPFKKLRNFSIQSTLLIPTGKDQEGNETKPYIDWNNVTWQTQLFNDISIGRNYSLFTEIDFLYEDIGNAGKGANNRISTPATLIYSYYPVTMLSIYIIGNYSPYFLKQFDYFFQFGSGIKYQVSPNFELELLYTMFRNKYILNENGKANTYNFGIRRTF